MELDNLNTQNTTDLLEIIQRQLLPAERERLNYLLLKSESDRLTKAEQKEFLAYADRIETKGAERARALVKLAQIRNIEPAILLDELLPTSDSGATRTH